jgi:Tol biopolymer transport system component
MKAKAVLFVLILISATFVIIFFDKTHAEHGPAVKATSNQQPSDGKLEFPNEKHLSNIKQLTFEGQNAEAYFVADGSKLIFQSTHGKYQCDQIFTMNPDGSDMKLVSTGDGRTTCSYIFPNKKRILYASTHLGAKECPPPVDYSKGYAWVVYPTYDIFTANMDGTDVKQLTNTNGYDAEATISRDGKKIVFTSLRDGDLDIYTMDANGKNVKRLTTELGYDGGPFWSADGKKIVYRSYHPKLEAEVTHYKQKLAENLIVPNTFEIWVMDADGKNKHQLTKLGSASFAPFMHPDGKRIIFSSNYNTGSPRNFDLYIINIDGTGLERITTYDSFDGFPMFSPDGRKLVFASNRNGKVRGETNIFIADWTN